MDPTHKYTDNQQHLNDLLRDDIIARLDHLSEDDRNRALDDLDPYQGRDVYNDIKRYR